MCMQETFYNKETKDRKGTAPDITDNDRGWLAKVRAAAKRRIEGRRSSEKTHQSEQTSDEELVSLINRLID